jgi:hypothetical protein
MLPALPVASSKETPTAKEVDKDIEKTIQPLPTIVCPNGIVSIFHPDHYVGERMIMEAFGITDRRVLYGMLRELAGVARSDGNVNEAELNFLAALVRGIKPRDSIEAMLAVQMVGVHALAMRFGKYLRDPNNFIELDSYERVFNKLTRTFPAQMEALKRYRSSGAPNVRVQNVSVCEGSQAIVGNVLQNGGANPSEKPAGSPALLSEKATPPMEILNDPERAPLATRRSSKS